MMSVRHMNGLNRRRLAIFTGYAYKSGSFAQTLADLRAANLIEGPANGLEITNVGLEFLGPVDPLPIGHALLEFWCVKRPRAEADVLVALASMGQASRNEIAQRVCKSAGSGSFAQTLANLRALGLIEGPASRIKLADDLRECEQESGK